MSLSEVIAGLEHDESVRFTREQFTVRAVAKKGDENRSRVMAIEVDATAIVLGNLDILVVEVRRAFEILRRSEATTDGN
jgi:hypothetical protein